MANFVNGELLGRIVAPAGQPAPWWSVKYPQEVFERSGELTDLQLIELPRAVGLSEPLVSDRVWSEFLPRYEDLIGQLQSGTAGVAQKLSPLVNARHPSQLYQGVAEGLVVGLVVWFLARRPQRPGIITAAFVITYGILRVATEFWRLPDAHFGSAARIAGLSRGQWLSVVMVVAGGALLVFVHRRKSEPMGGWGRAKAIGAVPDETS